MCDTIVALGNVTQDGVTLFGKNSDREPNEAHHLMHVPGGDHPAGSKVQCTYIEIPQVAHTNEILLAKPFWIWGAEMGTNEYGLTIGNEAVFTKVPFEKTPGLIGMDLLRLALERARTARQAVDVITGLLEAYGQSGNCGFQHQLYYHNSFLIADPQNAWTLQTAGRHWAALEVKDLCTISNGLTIGNQFDLASENLVKYAREKGWCKSDEDFHFARCYSDFIFTTFSNCKGRQCRSTELLQAEKGAISVETFLNVLRDHGTKGNEEWSPAFGLLAPTICMHAGFGPARGSQSTGSMVSHLKDKAQTHFMTATSAPCTGIFKPVWCGAEIPDAGTTPQGVYDEATLFWQHERLHRTVLLDFPRRLECYLKERDALEQKLIEQALSRKPGTSAARAAFSKQCFEETAKAEAEWLGRVTSSPTAYRAPWHYKIAWRDFNRQAEMPPLS